MKRLQQLIWLLPLLFLVSCALGQQNIRVSTNGMDLELVKPPSIPLSGHGSVSSNGQYFLTGGRNENAFKLWDLSKGEQIGDFTVHKDWRSFAQAVISPDNQYVLSSGDRLTLWNRSKGKEIRTLDKTKTLFISNFSSDGGTIASFAEETDSLGARRYWLSTWNTATWNSLAKTQKQLSDFDFPRALALTPDGQRILLGTSANFRGDMILMDTAAGGILKKVTASDGFLQAFVMSIAFSPDGNYALSGGMDNTVRVWEIPSMKELMKINAHTSEGASQTGVSFVTFSADGKYFLTGGGDGLLKMWDASSWKEIRLFDASSANPAALVKPGITYAAFLSGGKHIFSTASDGVGRIWDTAAGKEIALFFGFEDGEWLVMTSEGYYHSSAKGAQYLKMNYGRNEYTFDQFYDQFYRPDIVARKLSGQDISEPIPPALQEIRKDPSPVIEWIRQSPGGGPSRANICYKIKDAGAGIGEVRLFHNGKLVQSDARYDDAASGNAAAVNPPKGQTVEKCIEIETIYGSNEVGVTAFNGNNSIQSDLKSVRFKSKTKTDDPRLYILSVGIDRYQDSSLGLKYAAKDASDIGSRLRTQAATLFKDRNIQYELLTDDEASKRAIIRTIDNLAEKMKPQDTFILFFAGYGLLSRDQYYLLTHDFNGQVNNGGMISTGEITAMSKKIKALSQLFVFDACHADASDTIVSGLYNAVLSVLGRKTGVHLYASAVDQQTALDGYRNNGLFAHVLLEGLNNTKEALRSKKGEVTMASLGEYAKRATEDLSRETGRFQRPLIINYGRDIAIYRIR